LIALYRERGYRLIYQNITILLNKNILFFYSFGNTKKLNCKKIKISKEFVKNWIKWFLFTKRENRNE